MRGHNKKDLAFYKSPLFILSRVRIFNLILICYYAVQMIKKFITHSSLKTGFSKSDTYFCSCGCCKLHYTILPDAKLYSGFESP
jgi:hypothetical protein